MSILLESALTNAAHAAIIAVIVFAVTRFIKRPHVVYWLWLIVLLKLVTPPFFHVPVRIDLALSNAEGTSVTPEEMITLSEQPAGSVPVQEVAEHEIDSSAVNIHGATASTQPSRLCDAREDKLTAESKNAVDALRIADTAGTGIPDRLPWSLILGLCWLSGSGLWFVLATVRVYRFDRLIQRAEPASKLLQQDAAALALRFGLRHCPRILVVQNCVPPLLWSAGRSPVIALPAELLDKLDAAEQEMVVAHELAHCRRRDHWFRWMEVVILGLYWWHPIAWWARRELQGAEEQCCDAWVLWAFPNQIKSYARALLNAMEFLSASQALLPAGACGLGNANDVKRRFEMILQNRIDRRISWQAGTALIVCGCLMLSISARVIQAEVDQSKSTNSAAPGFLASTEPGHTPRTTETDTVVSDTATFSDASPSVEQTIVQALLAVSNDEDRRVRVRVLVALAKWTERSAPSVKHQIFEVLIAAAKGEDAEVRRAAVQSLTELAGNGSPEALSALVDGVADSTDPTTCNLSIAALDNVKEPTERMIGLLIRFLAKDANEYLVKMNDNSAASMQIPVVRNAQKTLARWGSHSPEVVAALIDGVVQENSKTQQTNAMRVLLSIKPTTIEVAEQLIQALEHENSEVRKSAAAALGNWDAPTPDPGSRRRR